VLGVIEIALGVLFALRQLWSMGSALGSGGSIGLALMFFLVINSSLLQQEIYR
jgi:hypothetical protein